MSAESDAHLMALLEHLSEGVNGVRTEMHALRIDLLSHARDVGDIRTQTAITAGEVVALRTRFDDRLEDIREEVQILQKAFDDLPTEEWTQTSRHVTMVRNWVTSSKRKFFAVLGSLSVTAGGSFALINHFLSQQ